MDIGSSCFLCFVFVLGFVLLSIKSALTPKTPVRGKTNVPGPSGVALPIIGNAWKFAGVQSSKDLFGLLESLIWHSTHRALSIWLGSRLLIATVDPKLNEYILNSPKAKNKDPDTYGHLNRLMDGVNSRNGEEWSDLRRPLNKFLQPKTVVENHLDVIVAKSEELCKVFESNCDKMFDILPQMQKCALDTTFETLMGIPSAVAHQLNFDVSWAEKAAVMWFDLATKIQYKIWWLFSLSKLKREMERFRKELRDFGKRLIDCRRRILSENGRDLDDPDFEPECYTDVAVKQALKEKREGYTMPIDLIFAGFDTSSVSLSTACLFLAMHPEYQEKAYQEQIAVMGDSLVAPTYEEITKMDYLGMVYLETLRHVGVPGIFRHLSAEVVLDEFVFPEGASIYVALHGACTRPEYWEKPSEFHPDHFLPENVSKRPKGAFLPFSAGARVCPGKSFAIISSKIILSMLLRRFHFSTSLKFRELEYKYLIMLESTKGYPVQLTRRPRTPNQSPSIPVL